MKDREKQNLAEKIARLLSEDADDTSDAKMLSESLEKINARLEKIESQLNSQASYVTTVQAFSKHPSQERFLNIEQIADEIIENFQNEKACPYEPTGKPCDNCAMCNSRGF